MDEFNKYDMLAEGEFIVKEANWKELNRVELADWDAAATMLKVLLDNGYHAVLEKSDFTYVITYDWANPEWSGTSIMWVENNF